MSSDARSLGVTPLDDDVVAPDPFGGLNKCRGDVGSGIFGFERDMLGDKGVSTATGIHEPYQPVAAEHWHREVPVYPLGKGT